ncbi:carbohydrate-binding domain-containing protein [Dysgonomonas sp. HDW5B]|uniref:carbohydrate-binding domain-containing protein n=1 Tax=Dysgonomonas sp. HDW5B TaxID=2714927 RepID=UPI0016278450|nr:carbohydrate-binding domain-containing protein [Dysgonomonas sp. HDW5B]
MGYNRFLVGFMCIVSLCAVSCSSDDDNTDDGGSEGGGVIVGDDFTTNTKDTTFSNAVVIAYSSDAVTITNPYADKGVSIATNGADVVVTSTLVDTEVNYVLSGTTKDGSFKIYSDYKFGVGLNGVSIVNGDGPAINIQSGKKVSIVLVGGTSNRLVDAATYTASGDEDMKGTLFSEGQLNFDGNGSLLVYGYNKHGIVSDDYIRINGGNITVKTAVKDGIHANDYVWIDNGQLTVTTSADGIECEEGYIAVNGGAIDINSVGDAIKTSYSGTDTSILPYITISGGTIDITTTGEGSKGLKSKGDITIADGDVELATTGSAYYDTEDADISSPAGLKADGNFLMEKGNLVITSSGAGGKGINIDGTLTVNGGTISVVTTGDQFKYGSNDTAAKAIKSDGNLTVNGGTITIKTSKTEAEGLESKTTLTINDGKIEIEAYDDCINASKHIQINGGSIYCYSETNDGIDSNGTLTITGGTVVSSGSTAPEEGLDCDNNTFKITGGTLIGIGGNTSIPTSNVSTQRTVIYGGSSSSNQFIHIASDDGTGVLTFKIPRAYSQMTLLFSSPGLVSGATYTIYTGGSISGGTDFHGLFTGAAYTKGTSAGTFTPTSMVTTVGNVSTILGGGRP